jgi:hypothetical protein
MATALNPIEDHSGAMKWYVLRSVIITTFAFQGNFIVEWFIE